MLHRCAEPMSIKTDISFPIFNVSDLSSRYRCILMLPSDLRYDTVKFKQ